MPTPHLTRIDLRREAFSALLTALKRITPELVPVLRDDTHDVPVELVPAVEKVRQIPDFANWAMRVLLRWRDDDFEGRKLTMLPVPLVPSMPLDRADPQRPILAFPDHETEDHFVAWARAHFRARAEQTHADLVANRPQLQGHAEWYVQREILGRSIRATVERERDFVDYAQISKRVKEFAELLGTPIRRKRGRRRTTNKLP